GLRRVQLWQRNRGDLPVGDEQGVAAVLRDVDQYNWALVRRGPQLLLVPLVHRTEQPQLGVFGADPPRQLLPLCGEPPADVRREGPGRALVRARVAGVLDEERLL